MNTQDNPLSCPELPLFTAKFHFVRCCFLVALCFSNMQSASQKQITQLNQQVLGWFFCVCVFFLNNPLFIFAVICSSFVNTKSVFEGSLKNITKNQNCVKAGF